MGTVVTMMEVASTTTMLAGRRGKKLLLCLVLVDLTDLAHRHNAWLNIPLLLLQWPADPWGSQAGGWQVACKPGVVATETLIQVLFRAYICALLRMKMRTMTRSPRCLTKPRRLVLSREQQTTCGSPNKRSKAQAGVSQAVPL
jgi:hypothetical protein